MRWFAILTQTLCDRWGISGIADSNVKRMWWEELDTIGAKSEHI